MALSPNRKTQFGRLAGRTLARLISLVERTSRAVYEPADIKARLRAEHPLILACWHGQFMMVKGFDPGGVAVSAMVARHGDAEVIGAAMQRFGVELIRGAGAGRRQRDRGGAQALRGAVRALESGSTVVMTADVPPGPARHCGTGIVMIAKYSGRPIVPVAAATSRYKALNTWSRLTINLPFSTLAYVGGNPIYVPPDADEETIERLRAEVERSLNEVTRHAYALAGADPARATPPTAEDVNSPPASPGLSLRTYRTAMRALRPFAPLLLKMRERKGKEDAQRYSERLGRPGAARPDGRLVWIHAASVGETNAVLPLIDALGRRRPDLAFLLTTGTVTSAGLAGRRLGPRGMHQYVPLDAPQFARTFLDHWRPDLAVLTESEIWPNLILETSARGIPLALVNARMSPRSFNRWKLTPGMSHPLFSRLAVVLAQNDKLARYFSQLGARNVKAVGNLKIDAPPPPVEMLELQRLETALAGRPRWIAASTHEGEERTIAEAHRQLSHHIRDLITIIVPRHPERGTAITELLKSQGLRVAQRSTGALPDERTDIYVADTIGELGTLYALSPVAFIGGSLVDRGGQNPIEAARHGAAVLTGPSWHNFRDPYRALLRNGGALEIRSAGELTVAVRMLLCDGAELARSRAGAQAALSSLSGALDRTVEELLALLPEDERLKRAS